MSTKTKGARHKSESKGTKSKVTTKAKHKTEENQKPK